jgi:hypothetical protein
MDNLILPRGTRGYNIGTRLIEEFLAKSHMGRCKDFRDTAEAISKVGLKMFLNISPAVSTVAPDGKSFSLVFDENPLAEFVELPEDAKRGNREIIDPNLKKQSEANATLNAPPKSHLSQKSPLWFSNILCGVIRGALEMVQLQVEVFWISDVLLGDETSEMRVQLIKVLEDEVPAGED